MNPFESSIRLAVKTNADLSTLFGKAVSNDEVQPGFILSAYRVARMSMREALGMPDPLRAAGAVLDQLELSVSMSMTRLLQEAQAAGAKNASDHLAFYQNKVNATLDPKDLANELQSAVSATVAQITAQQAFITALIEAEQDTALILGDNYQIGALKPGAVQSNAATWLATIFWITFSSVLDKNGGDRYKKVAVAALDNRTTDCCLRVHGQAREMHKKFKLTGTPRYADEKEWSPFHRYCRTSIALHLDAYDNGLTQRMIDSANTVLAERKNGIFINRHPADAFV